MCIDLVNKMAAALLAALAFLLLAASVRAGGSIACRVHSQRAPAEGGLLSYNELTVDSEGFVVEAGGRKLKASTLLVCPQTQGPLCNHRSAFGNTVTHAQ